MSAPAKAWYEFWMLNWGLAGGSNPKRNPPADGDRVGGAFMLADEPSARPTPRPRPKRASQDGPFREIYQFVYLISAAWAPGAQAKPFLHGVNQVLPDLGLGRFRGTLEPASHGDLGNHDPEFL